METPDQNPFPEIQIISTEKLRSCAAAVLHFFKGSEPESLLDSQLDAADYVEDGQLRLW